MINFDSFDPLSAKQSANTGVAANALKREIENILSSYVGWYDPFCELIQNALDSIEENHLITDNFTPKISIIVDIKENRLTVSDNGVGLDKKKFEQFLAPCFSFKSGNTRGHKGVGATYLAYGFNGIYISTKSAAFTTSGEMLNARKWLNDPNPSGNPEIVFANKGNKDPLFSNFDSGVSISLDFDSSTHPKQLSWLKAETASVWKSILLLKTGLGAFKKNNNIEVTIKVIGSNGSETEESFVGVEYYWPHKLVKEKKSVQFSVLDTRVTELFNKKGADFRPPSDIKNIESIYDYIDAEELISRLSFNEKEVEQIKEFQPEVYFAYMYTSKVWGKFNESLNIRKNQAIVAPGIQICANNMPQGEVIQIPLNRNIGRQNQISVLIHFNNCKPDMGRKGFQKDVVDISKEISRQIIELVFKKYKRYLRTNTGVAPDLLREQKVSDWKSHIEKHESEKPLKLSSLHFFKPINEISITSEPTREQDVISLFNQLIAGGVIRGIKIMSTNEMFVYDGMYRATFDGDPSHHIYDEVSNPLGVLDDYLVENTGFRSSPKILEYKYNLNGLIENLEDGSKNSNEIDLVIVWDTGNDYSGNYEITSLLNDDNLSERQYHGVSHVMTNVNSGQKELDLIVLSELISYLNSPEKELENQVKKYD